MHKPLDVDQTLVIVDHKTTQQQQHDPDHVLSIQQVAQMTRLSVHTLRYYERAGLMQPVTRADSNGYRVYTQQNLGWIEFIKRLRATGMPIRDIQHYTRLILQGEQTATDRMDLLKKHRNRVAAHLVEVEQHLAAITAKISYYEHLFGENQTTCDEASPLPAEPADSDQTPPCE